MISCCLGGLPWGSSWRAFSLFKGCLRDCNSVWTPRDYFKGLLPAHHCVSLTKRESLFSTFSTGIGRDSFKGSLRDSLFVNPNRSFCVGDFSLQAVLEGPSSHTPSSSNTGFAGYFSKASIGKMGSIGRGVQGTTWEHKRSRRPQI